jgi:LSD1 subclass zinc finger protein
MPALDTWAITLRCPHCGRAGTAAVSEGDADGKVRINDLSSGFVVVELRRGAEQDIRCSTCNSSALK